MPSVNPGESRQHYVSRCIPIVMHEGGAHHTPSQAAGKCHGMYDQHKKRSRKQKAKSKGARVK